MNEMMFNYDRMEYFEDQMNFTEKTFNGLGFLVKGRTYEVTNVGYKGITYHVVFKLFKAQEMTIEYDAFVKCINVRPSTSALVYEFICEGKRHDDYFEAWRELVRMGQGLSDEIFAHLVYSACGRGKLEDLTDEEKRVVDLYLQDCFE